MSDVVGTAPELTVEEREQRLYATTLDELQSFFEDPEPNIDRARMALKSADLVVKREGTRLHERVLTFSILQAVCRDDQQRLAKAVESIQPGVKGLLAELPAESVGE